MLPDNIVITSDIRHIFGKYLRDHSFSRIGVLVDENTRDYCLPVIRDLIEEALIIEIKSGEIHKNLDTCQEIWKQLTESYFDRQDLFINLGGGVIGDMGGFCAATYKRGIPFLNIPTTLLAQVDASVGGKLGIDFQGYKNHIGVFTKPDCIFIDPAFLETLPERQLRSGFAEVIKHALIADAAYWSNISRHPFSKQDWTSHIKHSVKVKNEIVRKDPKEKGLRKILNFGHTLGHAIESYFLSDPKISLLHGEAIAAGMIMESYLSHELLDLKTEELTAISQFILSVFNKIPLEEKDLEDILQLTMQDKKNEKGITNFSLLEKIGKATHNISVARSEMIAALSYYRSIK